MSDASATSIVPVRRPILGVSVGVFRDGRVLVCQRLREPGKGLYLFPGGAVEFGETLGEAALRELQEETAITADLIGFIDHAEVIERTSALDDTRHHHIVVCAFAARWRAGEAVLNEEHGDCAWVLPDELERLPTSQNLMQIVRKGTAMAAACA
jgi:ADP-ribose pyrophosphatase YjhB (NUDIX family)